jgi:DNA-binding MarR family transcriptional regulator
MTERTFKSDYKDNHQSSTGFLFIKVYNEWHSQVKQVLRQIELTHPQFIVLTVLGALEMEQELVTQVNLASFSDMDVMTVSQIVKLLSKKGLIERGKHPYDSRAKTVALTEEGRKRMNKALPLVETVDKTYFGRLAQRQGEFNNLLQKLEGQDG